MEKRKHKKKVTGTEVFFRAIQQDLIAIRADMATKEDIRQVRAEMMKLATREELREVREDVKRITDAMVSKADLEAVREELLREIRDGKHIEELRERLHLVEQKLGMAKKTGGHRAA
jgi:hypothetical protein